MPDDRACAPLIALMLVQLPKTASHDASSRSNQAASGKQRRAAQSKEICPQLIGKSSQPAVRARLVFGRDLHLAGDRSVVTLIPDVVEMTACASCFSSSPAC